MLALHIAATSEMLIPDVQVSNYTRATPPAVPLMANWLLLVAKAVLLAVLPFLLLTYTLVEYSLGGPRASGRNLGRGNLGIVRILSALCPQKLHRLFCLLPPLEGSEWCW